MNLQHNGEPTALFLIMFAAAPVIVAVLHIQLERLWKRHKCR